MKNLLIGHFIVESLMLITHTLIWHFVFISAASLRVFISSNKHRLEIFRSMLDVDFYDLLIELFSFMVSVMSFGTHPYIHRARSWKNFNFLL